MKINKKTKLSISIITIAIVLISVIAIGLLFGCNNIAYADYDEIINSNAIVNFNQWLNIPSVQTDVTLINANTIQVSNATKTGVICNFVDVTLSSNDLYYWSCNVGDMFNFNNNNSLRPNTIFSVNSDTIIDNIQRLSYYNSIPTGVNIYFNLYNLSQMFGRGNEPNLEQAQELFTSAYYPYTTGTPVALNSLNAYVNAYNDLFSSYQYLQTTNALGLNSYSYRFNNSDANFEYDNTYRMWYFKNTFATPLLTTLSAGTKITVNYKYWASNFDSTSYFLNVSYLDRNNGGISSLYTSNEYIISLSELDEPQTITFTLPIDIDTLYFNVVNNNNVDVNFNGYFFTFEILASQFDINTAIATAYQRGIDSISDRVLPGGDLYESIYTTGFNAGSQNGYIVSDSMSFVGQMFHGIGDILSMELIPNIPIGLFVALPLLVGLLFFIVKIAKGSGG